MEVCLRHEGWTRHGPVVVRGRAFDGERLLSGRALADRYRRVADVPADRAGVTDRLLARVRHTPARTVTDRGVEWEPPFLAPRSAWRHLGSHPLAWNGIVAPALLDCLPADRSLYAVRTLATLRGTDLSDPTATVPSESTLYLPTDEAG